MPENPSPSTPDRILVPSLFELQIQDRLEERWQSGEPVLLPRFWQEVLDGAPALDHQTRMDLLRKLIEIDLYYRWKPPVPVNDAACGMSPAGGRTGPQCAVARWLLEDYVRLFPELAPLEQLPLELFLQEYRVQRRSGKTVTPEEYAARFPNRRQELQDALTDLEVQPLQRGAAILPEQRSGNGMKPGAKPLHCPHCNRAIEAGTETPRAGAAVDTVAQQQGGGEEAHPLPVIPQYDILEELGRGGMGVVYKARHVQLQRFVALKMILSADHVGQQELARFRAEAEAVARLQHPNIVQIFEIGDQGGRPFFCLEYVTGGSLAQQLNGTPLPARHAAQLVATLAQAVQCAHDHQVVHRDLKPANILLTVDGSPKITDFGLAKRLDAGDRTRSGVIVGTLNYMAPEQADGRTRDIGPPADVYALGVILYECVTGRVPFKGESPLDTLEQVRNSEPVPPSRLNPKLPRNLETICLKCLEKDAGRRYGTARELADDLGRFLAGEPVRARPVGQLERGWRWCRRNPVVAGLLAAVVLLLVLGSGVAWALTLRAEANARQARYNEQQAEEKERQANAARKQAEVNLYHSQIALAHREWLDDRIFQAKDLLDGCPQGLRHWEWHYLKRLSQVQVIPFQGHDGKVLDVALSADCRWFVSASADGTVKVWDLLSGQAIQTFRGHQGAVTTAALAPDGQVLASAGKDGTVRIWQARAGRELRALRGHAGEAVGISFSPDGRRLASAGTDRTVRVWDAGSGQELLTFRGHTQLVRAVTFNPDGNRLASASEDQTVKVWDPDSGKELLTLRGHTKPVSAVVFSPDRARLASASWDQTVRVWDSVTGEELCVVRSHEAPVTAVAFTPDGQHLASVSKDGTAHLWETATGRRMRTLHGPSVRVTSVAFSLDGERLFMTTEDAVRIWDAVVDRQALTMRGHVGFVRSVAFSPDSRRIASASADATVRLWDAISGKEIGILRGHTKLVHSVAFSPDGSRLVSGSGDGVLKTWEVVAGCELQTLRGHAKHVTCVAFSPDGKHLASSSGDGTVKIWEAASGQVSITLQGHTGDVNSVAFAPDGKVLITAGEDKSVRVWDVATGRELRALWGHKDWVLAVACSSDGARYASAGRDQTIRIWDAASGKQVFTLYGHSSDVVGVAFSPDGSRLASASWDKTVQIWDTAAGVRLLTLRGHTGQVWSVAWSFDGRRLASASEDKTLRVLDGTPFHDGE